MMIEGGVYIKCRRERVRGFEGLRCRRRVFCYSYYKVYVVIL